MLGRAWHQLPQQCQPLPSASSSWPPAASGPCVCVLSWLLMLGFGVLSCLLMLGFGVPSFLRFSLKNFYLSLAHWFLGGP